MRRVHSLDSLERERLLAGERGLACRLWSQQVKGWDCGTPAVAHWYPLLVHPSAPLQHKHMLNRSASPPPPRIQLQMSLPWAPVPFDVMNNEDEFSFTRVFLKNPKTHCLWLSHQAARLTEPIVCSRPSYVPTNTIQMHRCCKIHYGKF